MLSAQHFHSVINLYRSYLKASFRTSSPEQRVVSLLYGTLALISQKREKSDA
jgi:hypothetical protein